MTGASGHDVRGFVARDRPFIDDQPARKYGWEALSRWGSRPHRAFEGAFARVRDAARRALAKVSRRPTLLAGLLFAGSLLGGLQSCAEARAVSTEPGRIDQVRLGFGLSLEGRVSPGCEARSYAPNDPIHLSLQVTDAAEGSVVRVSVRDVVTQQIAWSEVRPVTLGRSFQTFDIGRKLAVGSYRAESSLGGTPANPQDFVVRKRGAGVR